MTARTALTLHPYDDVAVALRDLGPGEPVECGGVRTVTAQAIPFGHKIALGELPMGAAVRKYGQVIGFASRKITAGEHVHTQNLEFGEFSRQAPASTGAQHQQRAPEPASFLGYRRADGRVGTRNYLAVVSTVNCSATVSRRISQTMTLSGELDDYPNVDGVIAVTHGTGCGMQPHGDGLAVLRRTLLGYLTHPNVAGVLVLGLGCEDNQIAALTAEAPIRADLPVVQATIQQLGGTAAAVSEGLALLRDMLPGADKARRTATPASELVLGTNCGGSDAFSGLTANPGLGAAVDLLVAHGGTGILGETPEIYGAEHLLASRAVNGSVAAALEAKISWWREYTAGHGGSMDNNPSPGNKAGGLTTILEKSLGAVAKGGTTRLCEVIDYAQRPAQRGLVFMDTPGYDPVSVTGIVAGGATVMCFTTGRGSVFGCKPVPCLKLATTSDLFRRMPEDMDVDCGVVLDGTSIPDLGKQIFEQVLDVASGRATKSETLGFGDEEFVPWQLGAVM